MRAVDFILEHDINTTSVYDIEMEQLIAEMEVYASIINECGKQSMILEYADDTSVFLEADDDTAEGDNTGDSGEKKKKGFFKKKEKNDNKNDAAKKKWYVAVKEAFIKLGKFIVNMFTRMDYDRMIELVEKTPDDAKWDYPRYMEKMNTCMMECIEDYNALSEQIKNLSSNGRSVTVIEIEKIRDRIERRDADLKEDAEKERKNYYPDVNKGFILSHIRKAKEIKESNKVTKLKQLLKSLEMDKKTVIEASSNVDYKLINECSNKLYKQFNTLNTQMVGLMRSLIKAHKPKQMIRDAKKKADDK